MSNPTIEAGLPYTWIVVVCGIIAFFDAFSIGANDVANSWATSVAARSVTLRTAVGIAAITEFLGALLLGAGVAETIRKGIIDVNLFTSNPYLLMMGMMCANFGSMLWVMMATFLQLPVSTTHSVVGAIIGMGIAAFGVDAVKWTKVSEIVASWFISPALAGVIGAILFLTVKFLVMRKENPYARAKFAVPIYYFLCFLLVSMFIFYKGSPRIKGASKNLPEYAKFLISFGIALLAAAIGWAYLKYKVFPHIEATPEMNKIYGVDEQGNHGPIESDQERSSTPVDKEAPADVEAGAAEETTKSGCCAAFTHGVDVDVVTTTDESINHMHDVADHFDGKAERVFTALQVVTASFASFAHGANDLANALAPFASCVYIYETGTLYLDDDGKAGKFEVGLWQIAFCAIGLDMGLFFLGYKLMAALGNNLTLISPSRGFAMELGAMVTVLIASVLGLPVSTTHCATGATAGVALTNGKSAGSLNWKKLGIIFGGWVITLPCAGLFSALLFSLMAYSPINYTLPTTSA